MISSLFHSFLYQPLFNLFVALYNVLPGHDMGLVILVVTVALRLVLYPLTASSIVAQRAVQSLQPKLAELKKQFGSDQQGLAQATMQLYKENKVNPFASCLPILIQLPVLIALYLVMRDSLAATDIGSQLYSFVANPGTLHVVSFGIFNLAQPNIVLALLAGAAQYVQAKGLTQQMPPVAAGEGGKDEGLMVMMNKQMLYMMPVVTVIVGFSLPSGLTLYWFLSTGLMALQQWFMTRAVKNSTEKK